jgi:DNA/RNA-binding domain of Phe-tRNA-synthetase-like protein
MTITLSERLRTACPELKVFLLAYEVKNGPSNSALINRFNAEKNEVFQRFEKTPISALGTIDAARKLYRKLGKDPTRYRVSSESLLRRVLLGKGLDPVNAVVDCLNIASMRYGLSIGAYDTTSLQGDLNFDIGNEADSYDAVGRGLINMTGIPVLKDELGAFGSSTTDSERSKVNPSTTQVLFNVIAFDGTKAFETAQCLSELLEQFAEGKRLWTLEG